VHTNAFAVICDVDDDDNDEDDDIDKDEVEDVGDALCDVVVELGQRCELVQRETLLAPAAAAPRAVTRKLAVAATAGADGVGTTHDKPGASDTQV
jgi:hypothetical protein